MACTGQLTKFMANKCGICLIPLLTPKLPIKTLISSNKIFFLTDQFSEDSKDLWCSVLEKVGQAGPLKASGLWHVLVSSHLSSYSPDAFCWLCLSPKSFSRLILGPLFSSLCALVLGNLIYAHDFRSIHRSLLNTHLLIRLPFFEL